MTTGDDERPRPSDLRSSEIAASGEAGAPQVRVDPGPPREGVAVRRRVEGLISEGGFGLVYRVRDDNLLRECAMKVLRPEWESNETAVRSLTEEAQIAAQLDHPNIVPVHELGVNESGARFFTMKRVRGRTLSDILRERRPADRTDADLFGLVQIFLKVCDAVAFAHSRGVVHRDLKPDNVMVGAFGEAYLMDWGVARLKHAHRPSGRDRGQVAGRDADAGEEPRIAGTPHYMAPEQARGLLDAIDERTDVFGLGAILYEILTGRPPYVAPSPILTLVEAQSGHIRAPEDAADSPPPPQLCRIAMKAMQVRHRDRYESATALKGEVERFLHSGWQFAKRTYAPGDLIVREGDPGGEAFIIVRGRCRATRTADGRKTVLREMALGDVFGETAILTGKPRSATVEAIDPVCVVVLTREYFEEEARSNYWIGLFVQALAERFREADEKAAGLEAGLRGSETVVAALRHLAARGRDGPGGRREAPWSDVRDRICGSLGRSPGEVRAVVERSGLFTLDVEGDVIALAPA